MKKTLTESFPGADHFHGADTMCEKHDKQTSCLGSVSMLLKVQSFASTHFLKHSTATMLYSYQEVLGRTHHAYLTPNTTLHKMNKYKLTIKLVCDNFCALFTLLRTDIIFHQNAEANMALKSSFSGTFYNVRASYIKTISSSQPVLYECRRTAISQSP